MTAPASDAGATSTSSPPPAEAPPDLLDAAKRIGDAARDAGQSAWQVATSFRSLVAADLALSRSAFGLTLVYTGIAIALGASAWLLLMGVLVLALQSTGLSLLWSLALPALLSATGAAICTWIGSKVFEDTQLRATRRQLARLGLAEDPAQVEREPERVP
jgi:uncharacterized membrane protein YqjE